MFSCKGWIVFFLGALAGIVLISKITLGATSNGFDFPLGTPNDLGNYPAGYIIGNGGNGWITYDDVSYDCGPIYHPCEDWNQSNTFKDWRRDNDDDGDPVFAVSNGVIRYAAYVSDGWGNVVLIEHNAPNNANFVLPEGGS